VGKECGLKAPLRFSKRGSAPFRLAVASPQL
jgi:hypothetical protein